VILISVYFRELKGYSGHSGIRREDWAIEDTTKHFQGVKCSQARVQNFVQMYLATQITV
jgi:hypothetical protein